MAGVCLLVHVFYQVKSPTRYSELNYLDKCLTRLEAIFYLMLLLE